MEPNTTDILNEATVRAIENARNGVGMSKQFSTVEELINELNSDSDAEPKDQ
jgi:antitoxin component of RelBE/YafQ-DinJ toxin-antitoxin module